MKNKVLLVDDSITIHRVIDLSIDTDRYDTIKVFTEEDAIQELKESNFDFILLDNKLENTNIVAYTATIKNLQPGAKIILLVGAFDKFDPEDLPLSGADDYLVKPFDSQSLTTKLTLNPHNPVTNQPKPPQVSSAPISTFSPHSTKVAPAMDEAFIKNIAHADIEREKTQNDGITPKPVNMDSLFHDPSLNPGKVEAKGNQLPYEQRANPFEASEEAEEQQTFDPNAQFEGLYPNNKEGLDEMVMIESGETFGIPSNLAELQDQQVQNNTLETGFANEKTFAYDGSVSATVTEKEFGSARSGDLGTYKAPSTDSFAHLDYSNMSYQNVEDNQTDATEPSQTHDPQPTISHETITTATTQQPAYQESIRAESSQQHQYTVSQETTSPDNTNRETVHVNKAYETGNDMKKTEESDFYQLDENDIFNNKPVTQIFEEEILSLNAPEKDSVAEKPISQKFEEEVLSIDEPHETVFQPASDSGAGEFFDPANLDSITEGQSQSKNISQKFEEEILSIDTPEERATLLQDEDERKKNIRESFDNEIMALSAPEGNDNIYASNARESVMEAQNIAILDDFSDDPMTQDFANEIFPRDDISNSSQMQNIHQEEGDEQVSQSSGQDIIESTPLIDPKHETEEPLDDFFTTDIKVSDHKPSIMDESLDLDTLLGMDLADLSAEQKAKPDPKPIIDAPMEAFTQVADSDKNLFANVTVKDSENITGDALFIDNPTDKNPSKTDDNLFGNITTNTQKTENSFFADDATSFTPKVDTDLISKTLDGNNFDLIQMDTSPSTNNKNNEDNILSGITVTISKNEIMKMLGSAIDKHFLEKAVQDVLAQNMREIVRAIVPAIAEKFIKEEIEKLKDENNNDGDI